jgi:hypothetical protein
MYIHTYILLANAIHARSANLEICKAWQLLQQQQQADTLSSTFKILNNFKGKGTNKHALLISQHVQYWRKLLYPPTSVNDWPEPKHQHPRSHLCTAMQANMEHAT